MKKLLLLLSLLPLAASAQTTEAEAKLVSQSIDTLQGWKKGGVINIGMAQTTLNNWAAGGNNSLAINALLSTFAGYKKGDIAWDNTLDLGYGLLKQGKSNPTVKTDDKIDFSSKFGRKTSKNWYVAGLINFKTQFAPGYQLPNDSLKISNFLAPAYLLGAIGLNYKPNGIDLFIAPLTAKMTFVNDQRLANAGAFGVEKAETDTSGNILQKGKRMRTELGGYIRFQYKKEVIKNVLLQTRLEMFSNYLKNPQNVDINWETLLSLKLNKYISTIISANLIYDDDIKIPIDANKDGIPEKSGPRTQFKEVLSVGFSYKF